MHDQNPSIGGFPGLEPISAHRQVFHDAPALSTGRACIRYILQQLRPKRLFLPYYLCETAIEPLRDLGIEPLFYRLDEALEIVKEGCRPAARDAVLYVNYFGLKNAYLPQLLARYGPQLIVDDTQAFFRIGCPGAWSFNSARKFFGVPDGAYLYGPQPLESEALPRAAPDPRHLLTRQSGDQALAYQQYRAYEASLDGRVLAISDFSRERLGKLDYPRIAARRRANFRRLHAGLRQHNLLDLELDAGAVPLYYPLLTETPLRQQLIERRIFVPRLWPEVLTRAAAGFEWEKRLTTHLSPLPLDQRYDGADMERIINEITALL